MKLYLLRHGDAVDVGETALKDDASRLLTPKGIRRSKLLAHTLRGLEVSFDAIFSSPLTRARQTAEIVERGVLFQGRLELTTHLSPTGSAEKLVEQINAVLPVPNNVLLVGHEPYLSQLISLLCLGGSGLSLVMKKGGLCRLQVETLRATKCAVLEWLVAPRVIESKRPKRKEMSK